MRDQDFFWEGVRAGKFIAGYNKRGCGGICYHPAYSESVAHTDLTDLSKFAIPGKKSS
jgi:hypothetical protein